jgi:hypothetical protein
MIERWLPSYDMYDEQELVDEINDLKADIVYLQDLLIWASLYSHRKKFFPEA